MDEEAKDKMLAAHIRGLELLRGDLRVADARVYHTKEFLDSVKEVYEKAKEAHEAATWGRNDLLQRQKRFFEEMERLKQ